MKKKDFLDIYKSESFRWISSIIILFFIVFWASSIRLSNWDLLTDQTTGEKMPTDLDTFYFLRISEDIIENGGELPEYDAMRYPSLKVPYTKEIMPQVIILMTDIANLFGEYTLKEVNIFSPVFFFFFAMIFFFILTYLLTHSKIAALFSTAFLSFVPAFLYRSMGGVSDHEAIGIAAFFIAMIFFVLSLKKISTKKDIYTPLIFGLLSGLFSTIALVSWGGIARLMYMTFSLAFLLFWLSERKNKGEKFMLRGILFYSSWFISSFVFSSFFDISPIAAFQNYGLTSSGIIGLAVLLFILCDFLSEHLRHKTKNKFMEKYPEVSLLVLTALFGIVGLIVIGKNPINLLIDVWKTIFHPWGTGRVGLTVAENAQPYLVDWISQTGNVLFWMFFCGSLLIGLFLITKTKDNKKKIYVGALWILLICGSLFSRISPTSLMNGTNFISQLVYTISVALPFFYFVWLLLRGETKLRYEEAFIISWLFFTLLSGRAAQRMFFAITPFVCFAGGYLIFRLYLFLKENKNKTIKPVIIILLILSLFAGLYSLNLYKDTIKGQAAGVGPAAHIQWQQAMAWVRENTPEGSIFIHWWDYGYWIQYLGERPTVTDGGHFTTHWDHLIGRYLLTTQNPDSAYSLMKSHNVSYLLIDQTDVGKYPAYSIIGSDVEGTDRYSAIPTMVVDQRQTVETQNGTVRFYAGSMFVDEDIQYTAPDGRNVFLPYEKAGIAGVIWRLLNVNGSSLLEQPIGVFVYNNQRYDLPIRYSYINGELVDYGSGVESVIRVIPALTGSQIDPIGALLYLSPKVSKGLFAQIYLLNDVNKSYSDLKLVHSEDDFVVQSLKTQGAPIEEFVFYQGFRGPIKIWEVTYPEGTKEYEEFRETDDSHIAELDNFVFVESD